MGATVMENHVRAGTVLAAVLWLCGIALVVVAMLTDAEVGDMGVLLAGSGGVIQIRGFIYTQRGRERDAYDLGREATVRKLR